MNTWLTAFVDESGTNELDTSKPGVSNLFICVAVLVDAAGLDVTGAAVRKLSQDLCGGAEIASKRIAGNHERRLKFLEGIRDLPFSYVAFIVNKDHILKGSGLQYKSSFYKYINRNLYERLSSSGHNLRIIADQFGGADFMASFVPYLERHKLPDLFRKFEHSFANSAQTPGIQVADLIAGTLSYCYDPAKRCPESSQFRELLRPREAGIQCWPWEPMPETSPEPLYATSDDNLMVALHNRVVRFLDEHDESPDPDRRMQATVLKHLFFARQFENRDRQAIVSDLLISRLHDAGFEELNKQAFHSRVVGKIRDDGIILAGTTDGYRLALTPRDIQDYLNHDNTIIGPMLARILKARATVKTDTAGRRDILDDSSNAVLKGLANTFQELQTSSAAARSGSNQPPTDTNPQPSV
jgi:hypothetical protein